MRGLLTVTASILAASCFVSAGAGTELGSALRCLAAVVPLAAGDIPSSSQFGAVACPATHIASAFRYDRGHRTTRLVRDLVRGEIVRAFPEFGRDLVRPGQQLTLVVSSGPVRIEQQVEALQAAKPHEHLFVRRKDGRVLSTIYAGSGP